MLAFLIENSSHSACSLKRHLCLSDGGVPGQGRRFGWGLVKIKLNYDFMFWHFSGVSIACRDT